MGRPASADPKEVVTLRLRRSTLEAYKAEFDDWRARMEAAIEAGLPERTPPTIAIEEYSQRYTAPARAVAALGPAKSKPAPKPKRFTIDDVRGPYKPNLKPDKPKR